MTPELSVRNGEQHGGFTLLEVLIAVALIMLAISGPFFAAAVAQIATLDSKNRFTASYLAQEGIEYARMLRDDAYLGAYGADVGDLSATAFYDHFLGGASSVSVYGCLGNPSGGLPGGDGSVACALDPALPVGVGAGKALQTCPSPSSCPSLYLSGGEYTLTSGTPTIYARSLRFYDFGAGVEIVSSVSWVSRGVTRSVSLTSYLFPWQ